MSDINLIKSEGKGFEKFWETVKDFAGVWLDPLKMKKMTPVEIDRFKKLSDAQIEQDMKRKKLDAQTDREIQSYNSEFYEEKLLRAQQRFLNDEIDNQINIDNVILKVPKYLPEQVSDESVNKDWKRRFFNRVKEVSDDDIQELWAQILAGEIKQPNTYNLRVLDILHNLSKSEADLFIRLAKISWRGYLLAYDDNFFKSKFDINVGNLLFLNEIGLVNSNFTLTRMFNFKIDSNNFDFINKIMIIGLSDNSKMEIKLPIIKLTNEGSQLAKLIDKVYPDDYLYHIGKNLKKLIVNCVVSIYDIINRDNSVISFNEDSIIIIE